MTDDKRKRQAAATMKQLNAALRSLAELARAAPELAWPIFTTLDESLAVVRERIAAALEQRKGN